MTWFLLFSADCSRRRLVRYLVRQVEQTVDPAFLHGCCEYTRYICDAHFIRQPVARALSPCIALTCGSFDLIQLAVQLFVAPPRSTTTVPTFTTRRRWASSLCLPHLAPLLDLVLALHVYSIYVSMTMGSLMLVCSVYCTVLHHGSCVRTAVAGVVHSQHPRAIPVQARRGTLCRGSQERKCKLMEATILYLC